MTTIITRSALVFWGRNPAPDVAYVVDGRIITWGEVMDTRRKNQRERLRRKRHVDEWRAHQPPGAGWQGYGPEAAFQPEPVSLRNL